MRTAFVQALIKSAKDDPLIHVITADLGFEVFEQFIDQHPNQFTNCGVSEMNMIGMAGGMASAGLKPVCFTIIPFITHRAFEHIRNDITYPNKNVKMVGVGAGFTYGLNGESHYALEDIALMRTLPDITILSPSDPLEAYQATKQMFSINGPVFLRLGRRGEPVLTYDTIGQFKIGKLVVDRPGSDLLLITTGTMLETALTITDQLGQIGIQPTVIHLHTLKPVDPDLAKLISDHQKIITLEEHSVIGGLGSLVAEINSTSTLKPHLLIGAPDQYYAVGGTQEYMKRLAKLDVESVLKRINKWLGA